MVVALVLVVLGGFLGLVINTGHLMMVRGQLQNACDAAALAAAAELDGKLEGIERARAAAVDFAARHSTDKEQAIDIDLFTDVVFGHWDWSEPKESAFTAVALSEPDAARTINAVQVRAGREESRGNPLDVFFQVWSGGKATASVTAEAIAVGGAPCEDCSVPLVFADCQIMVDDELDCGQKLVFHNDTEDNVGFTNLLDGVRSVNTHDIIETLESDCRHVSVGDVIGVGNGNNLNKNVVKAFEDFIERNGARVTVPVVSPPGGCPAKFNGMQPVVGFATFTITDVVGPPNHAIHIELDCEQTDGDPGRAGCSYFGTVSPRPSLVR
ncbi:MAG: pilus assembly protein TadG-related protein [Myxococcales bacterium]